MPDWSYGLLKSSPCCTELAGAPREVIVEALLVMEKKGMAR